MASFRSPKLLGLDLDPLAWIDDGTLNRQPSHPPGMVPHKKHLQAAKIKHHRKGGKTKAAIAPATPVTEKGFIDRIRQHEGIVPYMYRDTSGLVTVGIGFLIDDKGSINEEGKKMPFIRRDTKMKATLDEIEADFKHVKLVSPPHGSSYKVFLETFKKATQLELEPTYIEQRFEEFLASFRTDLRKEYPLYDTYPLAVRYALLDMIFNLGRGRDEIVKTKDGKTVTKSTGIHAYKQLRRALDNHDWSAAGDDCFRHGIGHDRNEETKNWFKSAAAAALPAANSSSLGSMLA